MQTDSPDSISVFLSIDGVLADGSLVSGPWREMTIALTDAEKAVAAAIIDRARVAFVEEVNTVDP